MSFSRPSALALSLTLTLAACTGPATEPRSSLPWGDPPAGGEPQDIFPGDEPDPGDALSPGDAPAPGDTSPGDAPAPGDGDFPAGSNDPWWAAQWCVGFANGSNPPGYPPAGPDPDPHADFYAGLDGLRDDALVTALRGRIDEHQVLTYDHARDVIAEQLDCEGGWLEGVYTGMRLQTGCTPPDANVMNTEHTWPRSGMVGSDTVEGSESDLHHLFPSQSYANSLRGSLHFGHPLWELRELYPDPDDPTTPSGSRLGLDDDSMRLFEPRIEHKGDVARAMFYYAMRYDRAIPGYEEEALRCWNALDPPSTAERARNDAIATQALQGTHNRNPFVDHPELVDRIADF